MTWTTAEENLRSLLSDGPTDKLQWRKNLLGNPDGENLNFKTFENRRTADLFDETLAPDPQGVFVSGVRITGGTDYPDIGQIILSVAPEATESIEATYYSQWFIDSELSEFLQTAINWLGTGTVLNTQEGLRPAALKYAAAEAYQKLALRWAQNFSDVYKMQDQDPEQRPIQNYMDLSKALRDDATATRDEFYKRQGRALQPLSATVIGKVSGVAPNS